MTKPVKAREFPLKQHQVLVIEDEWDIARLIEIHLRDANCQVTLAADGHEGMRQAFARPWDLVILDLRLPGPDGLSICRALRHEQLYVPILMLTAKSSELDRVLGLELGADDYLTKPFSVAELLARAKAIFRRVESFQKRFSDPGETLAVGPLKIDTGGRQVSLHGEDIPLTAREFDLLLHLARHPGQVFSRVQLLDSVWGYGYEGYEHTVNSHINRLRAKIESDPAKPALITTVWGVGYKLEPGREITASAGTADPASSSVNTTAAAATPASAIGPAPALKQASRGESLS
ncbi:MAG: response regulator transcription factor [Gammaproteobacteria bacterium]